MLVEKVISIKAFITEKTLATTSKSFQEKANKKQLLFSF
jgi:hypothetical protein